MDVGNDEANMIAIMAILAEMPATANVNAFNAKRHADFVLGSRATRQNTDKIGGIIDYVINLAKRAQTAG
jgi:hypothetical protein